MVGRIQRVWMGVAAIVAMLAVGFVQAAVDTKPAEQAAMTWLTMIDGGKYAESWDTAATYFKGAVTKADWESKIKGGRGPFGALEKRTLKTATYETKLPGAPDGEYVVMIFDASFAQKKTATETVTFAKDGGTWKAVGYFIK